MTSPAYEAGRKTSGGVHVVRFIGLSGRHRPWNLAPELAVGSVGTSFLRVDLRGFNEVPSISTSGTGRFDAVWSSESDLIEYTLRYSGLESAVTLAHIHFSQAATNGGIVVFLCTNLPVTARPAPRPVPQVRAKYAA